MIVRFAAVAVTLSLALVSTPARAEDWIAKSIQSSKGITAETTPAAKPKRIAAKTQAPAASKKVTQTAKAAPEKKQTIRAARTDDVKPTLQRRAAAPVTSGGEYGVASYYWQPQPVASGGRFNPEAMTAAHKTLPFGTRVRVTRQDNGRSVDVTINDRGPYVAGRIIDLSRRAARDIGMTDAGITKVKVAILGR